MLKINLSIRKSSVAVGTIFRSKESNYLYKISGISDDTDFIIKYWTPMDCKWRGDLYYSIERFSKELEEGIFSIEKEI